VTLCASIVIVTTIYSVFIAALYSKTNFETVYLIV
jgi:hypothetical protein